jgi:hypothetical protein
MEYLFMALTVFSVIRFIQVFVNAPSWLWQLATLALSAMVLLPWHSGGQWFMPLAVAGMVTFLQFLENILIAKSDEALNAIMRRR